MNKRISSIKTRINAAAFAKVCLLGAGIILMQGCVYHGAVFSEYSQLGMGVRADRQTAVPVRLNVGYEHAMVAVVPKHDVDADDGLGKGQVGSLISRNELVAYPPALTEEAIGEKVYLKAYNQREKFTQKISALASGLPAGSKEKILADALMAEDKQTAANYKKKFEYGKKLLRAQSYVASGSAAIVATVPKHSKVIIKQPDDSNYVIYTQGSAADRVNSAMANTATPFTPAQEQMVDIHAKIRGLDEAKKNEIFSVTAKVLGDKYYKIYSEELKNRPASGAFRKASIAYISAEGKQDEGVKNGIVADLLKIQYKAVTNE